MADNTTLNSTTGGDTYRSKDRAGIKTEILGLDVNPNGTEQLMAAAALADGAANPTIPSWGSNALVYNGTTWDRLRGDTTAGAWVQVKAALPAGTNGIGKLTANSGVNIGDVRNRPSTVHTRFAIANLTIVTTAYTVGDQAGTMISITGAASANGGTGILQSMAAIDKGDVGTDYRLHFWRSSVTLASDNAAFAVSDTDMQDWCGEVVMPSMRDLGANRGSSLNNIGLGYDTGAGTTLFMSVETRTANAVYVAATDLNFTPYLQLD